MVGPTITSVKIGSSSWTKAFKEFIDPIDEAGYSLRQLAVPSQSFPWREVDKVYVQLSENVVSLTNDKVQVTGVRRNDYQGAFSVEYDSVRFLAVINFANFIQEEKLRVVILDTVTDVSGNRLDGEWNNALHQQQSGNGIAGGIFNLRLNMLPGDISGNGSVLSNDVTLAVNAQGRSTTQISSYDPLYDLDGSGECSQFEVHFVRSTRLSALPNSEPPEISSPTPADQVARTPVAYIAIKDESVAQSISTTDFMPASSVEWVEPPTIAAKPLDAFDVQEKTGRFQPINFGTAHAKILFPLTLEATTQLQLISRVKSASNELINIAPLTSIAIFRDASPGGPVVSRTYRNHAAEAPVVLTSVKSLLQCPTCSNAFDFRSKCLIQQTQTNQERLALIELST